MIHKSIIVETASKKNSPVAAELILLDTSQCSSWWPQLKSKFGWQVQELPRAEELEKKLTSVRVSCRTTEGFLQEYLFLNKKSLAFERDTFLRQAVGSLLCNKEVSSILINAKDWKGDEAQLTQLIESLLVLAHIAPWKAPQFGKKSQPKKPLKTSSLKITVASTLNKEFLAELALRASELGGGINLVRTLAETPGNFLRPQDFRTLAKDFSKKHGFAFEFWNLPRLIKEGAGAFAAVVSADPKTESGLVILNRRARKGSQRRHVALVGKGICFDTGGYNVKTGLSMQGMHRDMTGAAVVMACAGILSTLHPDWDVSAYLALGENYISPAAYKPHDVVTASNGLTIEVLDTDAEGRMLLADALHLASKEQPNLLIDFATLTGAAKRALDSRRSAVFSNEPNLLQRAVAVGDQVGERLWAFPMGADYREALKSEVADWSQCPPTNPNADHIYAATFLNEFVPQTVPWIHVDLSAAENSGGLGLVASESTAFGIRWCEAFLKNFSGS